jgi:hypothetical protein
MADEKSILPLDAKASFFIIQNSVFDILQFKLCTVDLYIKMLVNFGEVATVPTVAVFYGHMLLFTHVRYCPSFAKNFCLCNYKLHVSFFSIIFTCCT